MGVHIDESILTGGRGIYTFRAQGAIYHRIGDLFPSLNERPRYLQTWIYDTEHELQHRLAEINTLNADLVARITCILNHYNPFVHQFRHLSSREDMQQCRLILREQPVNLPQYVLPTASQVAAIIVGGEEAGQLRGRDIIVEARSGNFRKIQDTAGYYDPLQYPLLLPCGTYGWDVNTRCPNGRKVTCRDFYAYVLQIRENPPSLLHRGGRLFQQYLVDNYVKVEAQRLKWVRFNQSKIHAELYQGLHDSLNAGENDAGALGRRIILPSSIVGSPRDMHQRFQDAMALVREFGKPDLFLTMTCNPSWSEIQQELLPGQTAQDRPDLLSRIFHSRFEEFKHDIISKGVLGRVIAYSYVIEFQKRGLPHAHMLLILEQDNKLSTPDDYDQVVRAEIPQQQLEPQLHCMVLKHMIHGPCGGYNRTSPCMKNGSCKRRFPKPFSGYTIQGNDSYPMYKRRDTGLVPLINSPNVKVDNSRVIPYNPWLLLRYDCHINVEICASIKSVKYLYKYIHKGSDRVSVDVRIEVNNDEIQQFLDARWVCAPEAVWRLMQFTMYKMYPSVVRLQVHLPNMQQVYYSRDQTVESVLQDDRHSRTMLTEFFHMNTTDPEARNYLYIEFPQHYRWITAERRWQRRINAQKVIGRVYTVPPSDEERFYLRVLLNHVRGPMSFEDLLTHDNIVHPTFKQSAVSRGLVERDDSIKECLQEATSFQMPSVLRRLFATILVFCQPVEVRSLWNEFYSYMVEDYTTSSVTNSSLLTNKLLNELNTLLQQYGKSVGDFDLPSTQENFRDISSLARSIQDELSIPIPECDANSVHHLNNDQQHAFDTIISTVECNDGAVFFVDGPGGTGKTYLYRAIMAYLRGRGQIVLANATSGIASTLLPGGRTAHSRFKLPLNPDASSVCSINKQSDLAELLRRATAILWDEASMANRYNFEALDRTLRDIMDLDVPFGGKVMILGGDFRQVLPVVPNGTQHETVSACLLKSSLWQHVHILRLTQNMRSRSDNAFSQFLLRVGEGTEPSEVEDFIRIPPTMAIPWEGEQSIDLLIQHVFPGIGSERSDSSIFGDSAILAPTNVEIDWLNDRIIQLFPGQEHTFYSFDEVPGDNHNLYQQEFLNSISPGGMPPHRLTLKRGAPIMLLRNIEPKSGLCNGTRLKCLDFLPNLIYAEVLSGLFKGTKAFIPRISLRTSEHLKLPFEMTRKQFPIRLSFALTINKAQGQTLQHVGIYLSEHVFSHGQLYVALSRGTSMSLVKVLVRKGTLPGIDGVYTRNVVVNCVLLPQN